MKKVILVVVVGLLGFSACEEETERLGCTDSLATNYDANAQVDDGSCLLPDDIQGIFSNGLFGGWDGDSLSAGYMTTVCKGNISYMDLTTDTTTQTVMAIQADSNGEYNVAIELVNPVDARYYGDGFLRFDMRKGEGETFETFMSYIYGNNAVTDGACWQQRRSDLVTLSALSVSSEEFSSVSIPLTHYDSRALNGMTVVIGVKGTATPDETVIMLDNIRWTKD